MILGYQLVLTCQCCHPSTKAPPSVISRLLKNTGKMVIVRGSGVAQGMTSVSSLRFAKSRARSTS